MRDRLVGSVPLYRRLATTLRYRIASGVLRPGDRLPSLREAQQRWRISLHTVRRAYLALEAEGLLEIGAGRVPRVARAPEATTGGGETLEQFAAWAVAEAARRFDSDAAGLGAAIAAAAALPRIVVAECGAAMAARLAAQVSTALGVPVSWCLIADLGARDETLFVGTYYHHQEMAEAAERRGATATFLEVELAPDCIARIAGAARSTKRVILCGRDRASAMVMRTELQQALGADVRVELVCPPRAGAALPQALGGVPVVFSPESWDQLTDAERADPRALVHETLFTAAALDRLRASLHAPA